MKKNNSKKTILITGGSSGIGMNLIKFFLKKNYKIINISRSKPKITNKNLTNIKFDLTKFNKYDLLNSIVFISSVMGVVGAPGQSVYSASKSGLIGLTRSLASELSKIKIKVNCVSPGVIKESRLFKQYSSKITKETIEQVKQSHPLGLGTFKDVNNAVNFLISEHSEWFTGQNFILDGGYSSQ